MPGGLRDQQLAGDPADREAPRGAVELLAFRSRNVLSISVPFLSIRDFVLKLLEGWGGRSMPPCSSCGRVFFVDPAGTCRGCIALRRLAGELRFVPLSELDASLTVYLLETCLHTIEYLRDVAHAQAERFEQSRQSQGGTGLGLSSNRRSERGETASTQATSGSRRVETPRTEERGRGERSEGEKGRRKEERGHEERERKRRRRG